jgi:nudix-type nucleoside diphosphatase (YffH/AdpP family)
MSGLPDTDRVRVRGVETLSRGWAVLKRTTFEYRRRDGTWQTQTRETYDRGHGVTVLPYNREAGTVLLIRQFRYPALASGHPDGMLVEACAGLLGAEDPEAAVKREAEEETGYRLGSVRKVLEAYMSPGSVTELLHFFLAEYTPGERVSAGGGEHADGEDIEVLELPFARACEMARSGQIADGKTVLLLQHLQLSGLMA